MKYQLISKKIMRNKDLICVTPGNRKSGYLRFDAPSHIYKHKNESLYKTPRGWFLSFLETIKNIEGPDTFMLVTGEVSITTVQKWFSECNINYNTGW